MLSYFSHCHSSQAFTLDLLSQFVEGSCARNNQYCPALGPACRIILHTGSRKGEQSEIRDPLQITQNFLNSLISSWLSLQHMPAFFHFSFNPAPAQTTIHCTTETRERRREIERDRKTETKKRMEKMKKGCKSEKGRETETERQWGERQKWQKGERERKPDTVILLR